MLYRSLLLFCICCFLLVAVRSAAAYTTVKAQSKPAVSPDSTAKLGTLLVKEEYAGSIQPDHWVTVNLPACVELKKIKVEFPGSTSYWPSVSGAAYSYSVNYSLYEEGEVIQLKNEDGGSEKDSGMDLQIEGENIFSLKVRKVVGGPPAKPTATFRCYIHFEEVYIKALPPEEFGEIKVTLDAPPSSGFSPGTETVAIVTVGGSTASAASPESLTDQGGKIASITIKENVPGAFKVNKDVDFKEQDTVKLVLSSGFTWQNVRLLPGWGWKTGDVDFAIGEDTSGRSVLYLKIINQTTSTTGSGRVTITATVAVNESIARSGKVEVSYEGTNPGVDSAVLTVAEYNSSGITVSGKTTTDVIAGRTNQRLGEFTVAEGMAGDLAKGRTVTLTLPEGAKWNVLPSVKKEAGNGGLGQPSLVGNDKRTVRFTVDTQATSRTVFSFRYGTVDLSLSAPEQIEVTVEGSAGAKGKVVLANVQFPVSVNTGKAEVCIGVASQPCGEVVIKENMPGALRARDSSGAGAVLRLALPKGVTFAKKPLVGVATGDLVLGSNPRLEEGDRVLVIPIDKSSVTPVTQVTEKSSEEEESEEASGEVAGSTVKISDISLTVDRTVPEGTINLELSGTALNETQALFAESLNKLEVELATCVSPAPGQVKRIAVFTIGSKTYKVGEKEQEIDVQPYIKEGRTYGPVRYIAYALGLAEKDVIWDGASQTVTLFRNNRVAQLQIGRKSITVQGMEVSTDVAPEIIPPGRVMLPYRWVATALGAKVTWQPDSQQVIITSQ